jgi:hypothetical protein
MVSIDRVALYLVPLAPKTVRIDAIQSFEPSSSAFGIQMGQVAPAIATPSEPAAALLWPCCVTT